MRNLLKMEYYQLFHNRVFWWTFVCMLFFGALLSGTYRLEYLPYQGSAKSVTDIFDGMVYDSTYILILLGALLALLLSRNFSDRTITQQVCAGHPRAHILFGKLMVYLPVFGLLSLLYPVSGSISQIFRYGVGSMGVFLIHILKAAAYSLLLNSVVFFIPIFISFLFRTPAKGAAISAFLLFVSALYLGYGTKLGLPLRFLPTFQIRQAVLFGYSFSIEILITGILENVLIAALTFRCFQNCDLK